MKFLDNFRNNEIGALIGIEQLKRLDNMVKKRANNFEYFLNLLPEWCFKEFNLMKGNTEEDYSLYASHSIWESREHFLNWTKSEAFRLAHKNAGQHAEIYIGPPHLETFEQAL